MEVCRLSEMTLEDVLVRARSLPFLASAQIFRVCDAEKINENDLRALQTYLDNPSPSAYLIFETDTLEKKHPLAALMESGGRVFYVKDQEGKAAGARLIQKKLKQYGKTIAPGALSRLENSASAAPEMLDTLADQLAAYAGSQTQITEDMAAVFEEKFEELNIFKLTDALIQRNAAAAAVMLEKIIREDELELFNVLGFLHSQVKRLWKVLVLMSDGLSEAEALAKCGIKPNQAHFVRRNLRSLSRERAESIMEGLFQLDWKTKSGRAQGFPELEAWLIKLAG